MHRAPLLLPSLVLALILALAACGGGGGSPATDTPTTAEDTATDTPSSDTEPTAPPSCDTLLLNNAGVPGGYPFTLGDDDPRKDAAIAAMAALSEAYSVETINSPSLAPYTYTPSWLTTFDLTPVPGDSSSEKLGKILEAFLAEGSGLFAFDDASPDADNGAETGTSHYRYRYTQTYCGEPLANAAVTRDAHPRGSFVDELQWADRGVLVADLRKDGLIHSFSDLLFPALLYAPTKPVIDAEAAAAALIGERLTQQACFGAEGHKIKDDDLGEAGEPVLLILEAADGLELHLAWPIGVYLEGTTTAYVDALTGVPLAWALHFECD